MRAAEPLPHADRAAAKVRRRRKERAGRVAEFVAAVFLMAKGYRIVRHREQTPMGELDLIAVRGRRLAFVEVKYRDQPADPGATVARRQSNRIARAAEMWAWKHPAYRDYHFGLDIITISPWRLPRHLIDGLQPI